MQNNKIKDIVKSMTLEEKAGMCSGADFWHTKAVERLNVPQTMVSDGPHGLRKQDENADHFGVNESIKAVCFPTGCAIAASFNRDLIQKMGETLGDECQAEGVSVLLGPAVNIKRSPLCGRNFEYYSEDPYLTSHIAGAFIQGVQSKNVGTSIKHFYANNQEERRMSTTANMSERTEREIYLAAFEYAIKQHKPWTVMCSYNKINGVYAAENKRALTDILRGEWGFDGYVVSDWGAVNRRVADLAAGMDLEMPGCDGRNDRLIVQAVKNKTLSEDVLDLAVERILNIVFRYTENRDKSARFDRDADHEKAKKVADETVVLLKNEKILPLSPKSKVAFIGKYAQEPRFQGGGSSHINSHKYTSAIEAAKGAYNVSYAQGFRDDIDQTDEALLKAAIALAQTVDVAVIFAGLPDSFESEGFDREHMRMPNCQNELIEKICAVQKNVVVVLHNGSPVEMPWIGKVSGIVEAYLGGQAIGASIVDILFGKVNPSGRLPETFPRQLQDNPSYLNFPGEGDSVEYREGIFVGYRYYDKKNMDVLFPFGHGLSYTSFEYSNLMLDHATIDDSQKLTVSLEVRNTGSLAGKEVVQLYVGNPKGKMIRPEKELRGFAKLDLQPGETKKVQFVLDKRSFAYWNEQISDWHVESGEYQILAAKSSRNIVLQKTVEVRSTVKLPVFYTLDTIIGDIMGDAQAEKLLLPIINAQIFAAPKEEEGSVTTSAISTAMQDAMNFYMPLRAKFNFGAPCTLDELQKILDELNKRKS